MSAKRQKSQGNRYTQGNFKITQFCFCSNFLIKRVSIDNRNYNKFNKFRHAKSRKRNKKSITETAISFPLCLLSNFPPRSLTSFSHSSCINWKSRKREGLCGYRVQYDSTTFASSATRLEYHSWQCTHYRCKFDQT